MWTIEKIKTETKGHFFSPPSMRFFNSRILRDVYEGPGGVYFVTSERYAGERRRYTVRKLNLGGGSFEIDTIGPFQHWATAREAKRAARTLATVSVTVAPVSRSAAARAGEDNASYRADMKAAGRGHLLGG